MVPKTYIRYSNGSRKFAHEARRWSSHNAEVLFTTAGRRPEPDSRLYNSLAFCYSFHIFQLLEFNSSLKLRTFDSAPV